MPEMQQAHEFHPMPEVQNQNRQVPRQAVDAGGGAEIPVRRYEVGHGRVSVGGNGWGLRILVE